MTTRHPTALGTAALVLLLATGARAQGSMDDAWAAFELEIGKCSYKTGYDEDDLPGIGENELAPGEREWRECVYQGIRRLVVPVSRIPDKIYLLIARDKRLTNAIERGEATRSERRKETDKLLAELWADLESERRASQPLTRAVPSAEGGSESQPDADEAMRNDFVAQQQQLRRLRDIQSMSQF